MKILKLILKCLVWLFSFFLLLSLLVFGASQTTQGRTWIYEQFKKQFHNVTHLDIEIEGFSFSFPFEIRIGTLQICEKQTKIVRAEHLQLHSPLFNIPFKASPRFYLFIENFSILDLPQKSSKSTTPSRIEIPLFFSLGEVNIQNLEVTPLLLTKLDLPPIVKDIFSKRSFTLSSTFSPHILLKKSHATLLLKSNDLASPFSIFLENEGNILKSTIQGNRFPLKLLSSSLNSLLSNFTIVTSAPLSSWKAFLDLNPVAITPLSGFFSIQTLPVSEVSDSTETFITPFSLQSDYLFYPLTKKFSLTKLSFKNAFAFLQGEAILLEQYIEKGVFKGFIEEFPASFNTMREPLKGKLDLELNLKGPFRDMDLSLQTFADRLQWQFYTIDTFKGSFQGKLEEYYHLKGSSTLSFQMYDMPLIFSSQVDLNLKEEKLFTAFEAHHLENTLAGEMQLSLHPLLLEGQFNAKNIDLSLLSPWMPFPMQGYASLEAAFMPYWDVHLQKWLQRFEGSGTFLRLKSEDIHLEKGLFSLTGIAQAEGHVESLSSFEGTNFSFQDTSLTAIQFTSKNLFEWNSSSPFVWKEFALKGNGKDLTHLKTEIDELLVETSLKNPLSQALGSIYFQLQGIQTDLGSLSVQGESLVDLAQMDSPFTLQFTRKSIDSSHFFLQGRWQLLKEALEMKVDTLKGEFAQFPITLLQPISIAFQPQKKAVEVKEFTLKVADIETTFAYTQEATHFSALLSTNHFPLSFFETFSPTPFAKGSLSISSKLEGEVSQPLGEVLIEVEDLVFQDALLASQPPLYIKSFLTFSSQQNALELQMGDGSSRFLLIKGSSPLSFSTLFSQNFALTIKGKGEWASFVRVFYPNIGNLKGELDIDVAATGTLEAPLLEGRIAFSKGSYENLANGDVYHLEGLIEGRGNKLFIQNFQGQDAKGGKVTAHGTISLNPNLYFPFEIQLFPSEIMFFASEYTTIGATGQLLLTGSFKEAKLQGNLNAQKAIFSLEESLPVYVKTIDFHYVYPTEGHKIVKEKETHSFLSLDIVIHFPDKLSIEDANLKSQWKGSLHITGKLSDPTLSGELYLTQGEYNLKGKILQLKGGTIHFSGPGGKKSSLYLVATKEIGRVRAEIIVKGPVNKLQISFRSNPPLSQREILSYILFDSSLAEITPDQGDQLVQSFISLQSTQNTSNDMDFLTKLRNKLPLDRLDFTTGKTANKEFALQIGKRITKHVVATLNQSITGTRFLLEVDIFKEIKGVVNVQVTGESQEVSLKWKKDY